MKISAFSWVFDYYIYSDAFLFYQALRYGNLLQSFELLIAFILISCYHHLVNLTFIAENLFLADHKS